MSNVIEIKIFRNLDFGKGISVSAKYGNLAPYQQTAVSIDNVSNATLFKGETTGRYRIDDGTNYNTKKPESLLFVEVKGQKGVVWLKVTETMKADVLAERENGFEVLAGVQVQFGIITGKTTATENRESRDWFATFYHSIAPAIDAGNGISEEPTQNDGESDTDFATRVAAFKAATT